MKPRIVCAANRYPDGTLIVGVRHWDPLMHAQTDALEKSSKNLPVEHEQGFIDQYRHFYTREEAWVIAEREGQIIRRVGGDENCLYSENLY